VRGHILPSPGVDPVLARLRISRFRRVWRSNAIPFRELLAFIRKDGSDYRVDIPALASYWWPSKRIPKSVASLWTF